MPKTTGKEVDMAVVSTMIKAHQIPSEEIYERVKKLAELIETTGRFNEDVRRGFGDLVREFRERITGEIKEETGIKIKRTRFAEFAGMDSNILVNIEESKGLSPKSSMGFRRILYALGINTEDLSELMGKFYPVVRDTKLGDLVRTLSEGRDIEEVSRLTGVREDVLENILRGIAKKSDRKVLNKFADGLEVDDELRELLLSHERRH